MRATTRHSRMHNYRRLACRRRDPSERRLVEVWMNFNTGQAYALVDNDIPTELATRMGNAVIDLLEEHYGDQGR